ncbi:unnamed protein product [Prunus armeniaca]|uniref:Uncharacterized protein n=1 Tax=Prunus armeniaca TaxID=36596 RepID=A0A6J5UMP0_PRUAR|nr:unnamed protein product [Prunus armeniaca]
MHDFCFTIPYGLLLIGGGLFGYFRKGSTASLAGGVGIGLLLTLAGYFSLKAFERKKNSYPALILETDLGISSLSNAGDTKKVLKFWIPTHIKAFPLAGRWCKLLSSMPAGVVAGISALMTGFYLYKIATGGNHIPAKTK